MDPGGWQATSVSPRPFDGDHASTSSQLGAVMRMATTR